MIEHRLVGAGERCVTDPQVVWFVNATCVRPDQIRDAVAWRVEGARLQL